MQLDIETILVWLIIGSLAGSLTGLVVKGSRSGFGHWYNLGIGLVGALIGGILFRFFGIDLGLSRIAISLEDVVSAFIGALLFLVILKFARKT